jgi:hypothetical protein
MISSECQDQAHADCPSPDTCECPCHEAQKAAIRAIDDVLERSAGAVTTRDVSNAPVGPLSAWEMDKRSPERSFYAPAREDLLYYDADPERAGEIERAEQLGMGVVSRIIDQTRREISGQPVKKAKPSGRCSKGGHPVEINTLSTVDQIGYRRDGQCPAARAGEQCGGGLTFKIRWPFRLFGRRAR